MSSDLVARLRRDHTAWLNECRLPPEERSSYSDAADEIQRLRAALREIVEYDGRHYGHDGNARIVNIARAALGEKP